MNALKLIEIARAKGYSISRVSASLYQTHETFQGKHLTKDFHGTFAQFAKHVKALPTADLSFLATA